MAARLKVRGAGWRPRQALGAVTLALGILLAAPVTAFAATFRVNVDVDQGDVDPGDGICSSNAIVTTCTLRAAIEEANANGDSETDLIRFDIAGGTAGQVRTINVGSDLPDLTSPVTIDGYTQGDAAPNSASSGTNAKLRVVVNGPGGGIAFDIQATGVTIKGLVIGDFTNAVRVGAGGALISGNFIGTNAGGTAFAPNTGHGVVVEAGNAQVGGSKLAQRNLISGNEGNGIQLEPQADGAVIQGNLIGTERDGKSALGNDGHGILVRGASNVRIGGDTTAKGNVIRSNSGDGVALTDGAGGVSIRNNRMYQNGGLGIDLGNDGVTPNDNVVDADPGINHLQNYPVITKARTSRTKTTIEVRLASEVQRTYRVQFFSNGSGNEAQKYIGQKTIATGLTGIQPFTFVPSQRVPVGRYITATATDVERAETSELSTRRKVVRP